MCATDVTARAREACWGALDLARATAGSIELVHVAAPRTADMIALAADAGVLQEAVRVGAEKRLVVQRQELGRPGVPVTAWLAEGDVETAILARARETSADL